MKSGYALLERTGRVSVGLGLTAAALLGATLSPAVAGFFLSGLALGTINLYVLALTVEQGLPGKTRRRVQVFFLFRFLLRYALVLAAFYVLASLSVRGLVSAAGGFLLPEFVLWVQALGVFRVPKKKGG